MKLKRFFIGILLTLDYTDGVVGCTLSLTTTLMTTLDEGMALVLTPLASDFEKEWGGSNGTR